MTLSKQIAIILMLSIFYLSNNNVCAQITEKKDYVFSIESLDGKPQKIYVTDDYLNNSIKIKCLNDSLRIDDTYEIEGKAAILSKNFLEVFYHKKIGSNIHEIGVLFLCVNKDVLCEAIHITYTSQFELTEVFNRRADSLKLFDEKSIYEVKLKLNGENSSNYKLLANIHDMNSSKHDPSTNYNHDDKTVLNFDAQENIFYNDFIEVNAMFNVYDPDIGEHKQRIAGNFPVIKLGRMEYYYINNVWYEGGKDGHDNNILDGYSTRMNAH